VHDDREADGLAAGDDAGDPATASGASGDSGAPGESADSADASSSTGGHGDHGVRPASARWPLLLGVAAAVLALDQLSKAWAVSALGDGHIIDLVGSLRLRLTMNYGSAFSIANGRGALISLLALAVVAVLLATGRHARSRAMALALGLVVGGAFGNLVDRAFREGDGFLGGGVVDFVDLQWWPVFNVADAAIVIGALLLFLVQWREADEPISGHSERPDGSGGADTGAGPSPAAPPPTEPS
jgi:signal peptidase II